MDDASSPALPRILEAARDVGIRDGVDAIGARSVARAAGISPSLVSYHFKGTGALLLALHDSLIRAHYADVAAMAAKAEALPRHLVSPAGFLAATATTLTHRDRARTVLLFELHMRAVLHGDHIDAAPVEAAINAVGHVLGLADDMLWAWGMMAHAGMWYALLDDDPVISQTWLTRVFTRFATRIAGRENETGPPVMPSSIPPAPSEANPAMEQAMKQAARVAESGFRDRRSAEGAELPRAKQVVDAAIRLISRGEKITHRTIAAEAELPLATTTYLFASKRDILGDAYRRLYRQVATGDDEGFGDQPLNAIGRDGRLPGNLALFGNMLLHLARENDNPALAGKIRDTSGATGLRMLRRGGIAADAVDGLLLAFCMGPYSPAILGVPLDARFDHIESRVSNTLTRLFGTAHFG